MRRWGILTAALVLSAGLALAQKPPPAEAPAPGPRTAKPAPAPNTPGAPARPAKPQAQGPSQTPPPTAPAPQVIPADEPATVGMLRRLLGAEAFLAYEGAEVTDPARGAVRLTGASITPRGKPPLRMASLTLDGLRADGLGEADARGITFQDGQARLTIDRLQLTGLTLRNPAAGQPRTPDLVSLDSLRLEGMVMRQANNTEFRIGQAALEDYGTGRQTRLAMNRLAMKLKPGEAVADVTLARLELRGLDVATIATAMAAGNPAPATGRLALELDTLAATNASGGVLASLESLRMVSDQPATGQGVGTLAMRTLRLNPIPGLDTWMRQLGYASLLFDLTADSRYDPETGRLALTSLSLVGREIGTIALAFGLDGAQMAAMQRQDYSGLRLITAGLRFIDQGIFSRVLRQQATGGTTEAQLREQYANLAGGALAQPALTSLREAVQRFIRGQAREVEITLNPPQPVPLLELQQRPPTSPMDAAQRLGLGATAR